MKQLILAAMALLLMATAAMSQPIETAELIDYGFVLKRLEAPAPEPETVPIDSVPAPDTPPEPEQEPAAAPTTQLGIPDDYEPEPQPYKPEDRIIPGPPIDDNSTTPPREPSPGKWWIKSKLTGKWYEVSRKLKWHEFPNGDLWGCPPDKQIIFSKTLQKYLQVDPGFTYWDTADGLIATLKQNKLVQGPITGNYYEISRRNTLHESLTTHTSSNLAAVRRPALLSRNRWIALPLTKSKTGVSAWMTGPDVPNTNAGNISDAWQAKSNCPSGNCSSGCCGGCCGGCSSGNCGSCCGGRCSTW